MALLIHLAEADEDQWADGLRAALGDYPVFTRAQDFDPASIRYMLAWKPEADAFTGLVGLKAVLSLGAGVDALLGHPGLPAGVPIVRFVDETLTQCMSDYVVSQVAMHQRLHTRYQALQKRKSWIQFYPPAAWTVTVGIMGLGELGRDAAQKLLFLGFPVNGWSRTPKDIEGVTAFAGPEGFEPFLAATDILVNLLPLTEETRGILNYQTFGKLRRGLTGGPAIVNAARGGHQVEADIVRALGDGTLAAASLDVFETEPLPPESPLWEIETCFVTPHIAAISDRAAGTRYFAEMLLDHEAGKPLRNLVDVRRGY